MALHRLSVTSSLGGEPNQQRRCMLGPFRTKTSTDQCPESRAPRSARVSVSQLISRRWLGTTLASSPDRAHLQIVRQYRRWRRTCSAESTAVKRSAALLGSVALSLGVLLSSVNCTAAPGSAPASPRGIRVSDPGARVQSVSERARDARKITERAHAAIDDQHFDVALDAYTQLAEQYGDLALASYARVGRTLLLYQTGQRQESILELQGLASSLRGYAEVHAALAAMLYDETPPAVQRAELQWEIATEFDTRFGDPVWVQTTKHWPPAMLQALRRFLNLSEA